LLGTYREQLRLFWNVQGTCSSAVGWHCYKPQACGVNSQWDHWQNRRIIYLKLVKFCMQVFYCFNFFFCFFVQELWEEPVAAPPKPIQVTPKMRFTSSQRTATVDPWLAVLPCCITWLYYLAVYFPSGPWRTRLSL
jgi:hypothetical protein